MAFGLSPTGFNKKKLTDIKSEIEIELTELFGPVDLDSESTFSQLIGVFSEREASIWDLNEQVYLSQYPQSADGVSLDNVVDINGLTRLGETSSTAFVTFFGADLTFIPENTLLSQETSSELFEVKTGSGLTIQQANSAGVILSLTSVADSTIYGFDFDDGVVESYSINSGIGATTASILQLLIDQINIQSPLLYTMTIQNDFLVVERSDSSVIQTTFTVLNEQNVAIEAFGTQGNVKAVNEGALTVPVRTIINIVDAVAGLDQINNVVSGIVGRNQETDIELRARRKTSLQISGAGTVPSIEAGIVQNIEEISDCTVIENRTDVVDANGLPPHSFTAIITTSNESAVDVIAQEIWRLKPAGIQTFGNQSGNAFDSQGIIQIMNFAFVVKIFVYLDVEIKLYDEEIFPVGGEALIEQALADLGNEMATAGLDVIRQRLYQAVFSVAGVSEVSFMHTAGRSTTPLDTISDVQIEASGANENFAPFTLTDDAVDAFIDVEVGMWTDNVDHTERFARVFRVVDVNTLEISKDIFTSHDGDNYTVGEFQNEDLPIQPSEISIFKASRNRVTVV